MREQHEARIDQRQHRLVELLEGRPINWLEEAIAGKARCRDVEEPADKVFRIPPIPGRDGDARQSRDLAPNRIFEPTACRHILGDGFETGRPESLEIMRRTGRLQREGLRAVAVDDETIAMPSVAI